MSGGHGGGGAGASPCVSCSIQWIGPIKLGMLEVCRSLVTVGYRHTCRNRMIEYQGAVNLFNCLHSLEQDKTLNCFHFLN